MTRPTAYRDKVMRLVAARGGSNVRVYGSVAHGEDGPDSDIDLLVDYAVQDAPWFSLTTDEGTLNWQHDGWLSVDRLWSSVRRAAPVR